MHYLNYVLIDKCPSLEGEDLFLSLIDVQCIVKVEQCLLAENLKERGRHQLCVQLIEHVSIEVLSQSVNLLLKVHLIEVRVNQLDDPVDPNCELSCCHGQIPLRYNWLPDCNIVAEAIDHIHV